MEYPEQLPPAYVVSDGDTFTDIFCEDHAREFAESNGLVWRGAPGDGYTEQSDTGHLAHQIWLGDGETDTPYSCGAFWRGGFCAELLECRLTPDGVEYLRENFPPAAWHLWGVTA